MLLDEKAREAAFAALHSDEEVHQSSEPELSVQAEEQTDVKEDSVEETVETSEETQEEASTLSDDESDEGHSIPYTRFKSVIEARNKYKSKTSELERQLEEYKAQLEEATSKPSKSMELQEEDDWLDSVFNDDVESDNVQDDRYSMLEQRIQSFETERAQAKLEAELQVATMQYPDVPENVLLQAVIRDPSVDVMEVAEQWNTYMVSVEERAVAKYLEKNKVAAPPTPKRPSPSSGTTTVSSTGKKPKSLAEARALALDAWKKML